MPHVKANGVELFYELFGDSSKPTFVMTHGLGGHGRGYENQIEALSAEFQLMLWDMRGFGQSERVPVTEGAYSRWTLAKDLSELLKATGINQAHIHGHSLGGLVSQQFAIDYPDQTLSLVIQDTSAEIKAEYLGGWDGMLKTVREQGIGALPFDPQRSWGDPYIESNLEDIRAFTTATAERNAPEVYAEGVRISGPELSENPVAPQLGQIACPVLVICGDQDRLTPPGGSVRIHRAIPQSKLVILPGSGHFPNIETTDAFNQALLEFLREASSE